MTINPTSRSFPPDPIEPPSDPAPTPVIPPTVSPLLDRFVARPREELLAIPGMNPAKVATLAAARDAGKIDRWGDVEALAGFDAATMKAIYRSEAAAHVKADGLGRGSSVLFLASMPRNVSQLDLDHERDRIDDRQRVVEIKDPTLGEIEALAATGSFRAVWVAGHGEPGLHIFSDADGKRKDVKAEDFARAVAASPEVKFVMASHCHGASSSAVQKTIDVIAMHGPSVAGYANQVSDDKAIEMSAIVARALASGVGFRAAVAAAYFTVYPKDLGRGVEPRRGFDGRGGFAPREVRRLEPLQPPPNLADYIPFVQFKTGANEAAPPKPPGTP